MKGKIVLGEILAGGGWMTDMHKYLVSLSGAVVADAAIIQIIKAYGGKRLTVPSGGDLLARKHRKIERNAPRY